MGGGFSSLGVVGAIAFASALAAIGLANRTVLAEGVQPPRIGIPLSIGFAVGAALTLLGASNAFDGASRIALLAALCYFAAFDLRFMAAPVWPMVICIAGGLIAGFALSQQIGLERVGAAITGGGALVALDWIYRLLRGRSGLGFGDALAAALIGSWLGWDGLVWSIALGALLGAAWMIASRRQNQAAPFVPALTMGVICFLVALGAP